MNVVKRVPYMVLIRTIPEKLSTICNNTIYEELLNDTASKFNDNDKWNLYDVLEAKIDIYEEIRKKYYA